MKGYYLLIDYIDDLISESEIFSSYKLHLDAVQLSYEGSMHDIGRGLKLPMLVTCQKNDFSVGNLITLGTKKSTHYIKDLNICPNL